MSLVAFRRLAPRLVGVLLALSSSALAAPPSGNATRLTRARLSVSRIDSAAIDVQRALAHARARRGAPAVACVDAKLSQVHAQARLARARYESLRRALASGDSTRAAADEHALRLMRKHATALGWAAQHCTRTRVPSRTEVRVSRAPRR